MNKLFLFLAGLLNFSAFAQLDVQYQMPPEEIRKLVDIVPTPSMMIEQTNRFGILFERNVFKGLDELAEEEIRLGGLRIDPASNGQSRKTYYKNLKVLELKTSNERQVSGLPKNPRLSDFGMSPDGKLMAFTNTTDEGIFLYILNVETASASALGKSKLNGVMGNPFTWCPDSKSLLIQVLPENRVKPKKALPTGPAVQEATGNSAPVRTYQDLLRNKQDEAFFEYYATSRLDKIELNASQNIFLPERIFSDIEYSPDGQLIRISFYEKPYSYIVPYNRFPEQTNVYNTTGKLTYQFYSKPLIEELPKGFDAVEKGRRYFSWRADHPATLVWCEAQDGGDPAKEVEFRDFVYQHAAPFSGSPELIAKTKLRYRGITWGNINTAILFEGWWKTRETASYLFSPGNTKLAPRLIEKRSTQELYKQLGNFATELDANGRFRSLKLDKKGKKLYLTGEGYAPEGNRPFVDEFDLATFKTKRLWRAEGKSTYEAIIRVIDWEKLTLITRIESPTSNPNYHFRVLGQKTTKQITFFPNPYESFMGVTKEKIEYTRKDGVALNGTLYLPAGYNKEKDGPLPVFMWAYPTEFKSADEAGQVKESPHKFTQLFYGSPIYWAARGYAILDNASFPIIGEGDKEPNDSFIEQLIANAEAAIDKLDAMGVGDRKRIAVGGHSYGAFMTANLLAHTDLFAAGIARSGAYNRTLTPFGFQSEERSFWDDRDLYLRMSPFTHADKIKTPILLIHGDADNNPGTFTLQSERLFGAIKGLGGIARLVLLPHESHGYAARENILHMMWEQDQWLETYVKNRRD
jgi:dipeptidyl aminopeptidase/acylaminoacyl peptidase